MSVGVVTHPARFGRRWWARCTLCGWLDLHHDRTHADDAAQEHLDLHHRKARR